MKLKYEFECMELEDHYIAVPIGEKSSSFHGVVKLNDIAACIFELLKKDVDEGVLIDALLREYDASKEDITRVVHQCLSEFKNKGILEE